MSGSTSSTQSLAGLLCAAAAFTLAVTGACAVGDVPTGQGQRIPSGDPAVEARLDGLDIICESTLIVTGTFVEGIAQPAELLGCWPVGTWTVMATIDRLGCRSQPDFVTGDYAGNWVYEVVYDDEASTHNVQFLNDPDDDRVNLKISTSGDSLCHGAMDHFALDNTVVGLRPTLQLDGTLQGIGTYTVYMDDTF